MRKYNEQEQKLVDKMIGLGINISYKGFNYILDAVQIIHSADDWMNLTDIYANVAIINNTTSMRVERCIRTDIIKMYETNYDIPRVLIADPNKDKLTNGEFLYRLTYWLYK